jgi:hypothetical protein
MDEDNAVVDPPVQIEGEQVAQQEPEQGSMLDAIKADLAGQERGPDGKFIPKQQAADPATPANPANPLDPKTVAAPKADDALAMPEGLSEGAQARFQKLAGMVKERDEQLAEVSQTLQTLGAQFQESGVDAQVLNDLLAYSKVVTSGDVPTWETMLRAQVRNFELATGQAFQAADPFAAHQDIAQAVAERRITSEHARELVSAREMQQRLAQQDQARQQQQVGAQQREQAINQAANQVQQLVQNWAAKDLDWPRKAQKLQEFGQKLATNPNINPQAWPQMMEEFYGVLTAAPAQPSTAGPSPLRAAGASMGVAEPKSMFEAIQRGLS